jgi:hypothetical protein
MQYLEKTFNVAVGSKPYRDNWDAIFGKKDKAAEAEAQPEAPTPKTSDPQARQKLYAEVEAERLAQDEKWGGPSHDDEHTVGEWVHYIEQKNGSLFCAETDPAKQRKLLVQIAALAVAAAESIERKTRQG